MLAVPATTGSVGKAFFDEVRASGDKWNYGTPGVGTVAHLGMELLKAKAGLAPVHVPYPGNPQHPYPSEPVHPYPGNPEHPYPGTQPEPAPDTTTGQSM